MRWLEAALGFETTFLLTDSEGRLAHAEGKIGEALICVGGEWEGPQLGGAKMRSPASLGGAGTQFLRFHLESGLDEHCARARAAGANITDEPANQFYGARTYRVMDPEGHIWNFSQAFEEVSGDEMTAKTGLRVASSLAEV
jgi:uncharacterized glyoxalase superfamily protein PhnB